MLELFLDCAEPRVKRDLMWLTLVGNDWRQTVIGGNDGDTTTSVKTYIDPIASTAMLQPLQLADGWHYNHGGNNAKGGLGQFNVSNPNDWREVDGITEGDTYIESVGNAGSQTVKCNTTFGPNQPVYFSTFCYNTGNDVFVQAELHWDNGVKLVVWSNGEVEVWKGSVFQKKYSVNAKSKGDRSQKQQSNNTLDMCVFPMNVKDLLVVTNEGGGFIHTFSEIEDGSNEAITNGAVTLKFPAEGKKRFQFSRVVFETSGTLISRKVVFRTPPAATQTQGKYLHFDANGTGLTEGAAQMVKASDTNAPFVANDEDVEFRVKIPLSGSGFASPYAYAWSGGYLQEYTQADDSEVIDVLPYIERLSIGCDANGKGGQISFEFRDPSTLPFASPEVLDNRSVCLRWSGKDVFRGRTEPPETSWGKSFGGTYNDHLAFTANDYWSVLESYVFSDAIGMDGWRLDEALKFLFGMAGFGPDWLVIPTFEGFTIPKSGRIAQNRWGSQIQVGDTAGQWVARLLETYAGTYVYNWKPHTSGFYKYVVEEPDDAQAETLTLFDNAVQAYNHVNGDPHLFYFYNITGYRQKRLPIEANVIYVTGRDSHTDAPIFVVYEDADSANPELPPSLRPDNHIGIQRKYGYIDPAITTMEAAEYCADILFERLTKVRYVCEFDSRFLVDDTVKAIWRGDVVKIVGRGRFRITSVTIDVEKDFDASTINGRFFNWSSATYTGEYIGV